MYVYCLSDRRVDYDGVVGSDEVINGHVNIGASNSIFGDLGGGGLLEGSFSEIFYHILSSKPSDRKGS